MSENPEIGRTVATGNVLTNYHDLGPVDGSSTSAPVLMLHGSGPGVSAWANWRLTIGALSGTHRCIAPDLAGFGYSTTPAGYVFGQQGWLDQILALLDALGIERANVIGNSFGGSMALALAIHAPDRVDRLILMGSVGVSFPLTDGLDQVWGYTPSKANMEAIMRIFAFDQALVGDGLVQMRYEASLRPGVQDAFSAMFPAPRQRWVEALAHPEDAISGIPHPTLLVHGRDDKVIPLSTSLELNRLIDDSQLHIFGRCGHWTQIEKGSEFCDLVGRFLDPQN